jgi:hypothetical protein
MAAAGLRSHQPEQAGLMHRIVDCTGKLPVRFGLRRKLRNQRPDAFDGIEQILGHHDFAPLCHSALAARTGLPSWQPACFPMSSTASTVWWTNTSRCRVDLDPFDDNDSSAFRPGMRATHGRVAVHWLGVPTSGHSSRISRTTVRAVNRESATARQLLVYDKAVCCQWPARPLRPAQNATNLGGRTPEGLLSQAALAPAGMRTGVAGRPRAKSMRGVGGAAAREINEMPTHIPPLQGLIPVPVDIIPLRRPCAPALPRPRRCRHVPRTKPPGSPGISEPPTLLLPGSTADPCRHPGRPTTCTGCAG